MLDFTLSGNGGSYNSVWTISSQQHMLQMFHTLHWRYEENINFPCNRFDWLVMKMPRPNHPNWAPWLWSSFSPISRNLRLSPYRCRSSEQKWSMFDASLYSLSSTAKCCNSTGLSLLRSYTCTQRKTLKSIQAHRAILFPFFYFVS